MPTKIFVGNIALETSRELLMPLFQRYGQVTECDVLGSYGFVHMASEDDAKRAITELNGCTLNGNRLNVEMSTANTQGKKKAVSRFGTTKIFVGNIRDGTTSEQLRALFQPYGRVTEADVLSGFGFVHMDNEQEARNAIRALNSQILNGNRINVEMSTNPTPSKARDRETRSTVRMPTGPRYDSYPTSIAVVPVPRRSEQYTYDSYAGAAAAGTAHATSNSASFIATPVAPVVTPAVSNEPFRVQAVAAPLPAQSSVIASSEPYRLPSVQAASSAIVSDSYRIQTAPAPVAVSETPSFRLPSAAGVALPSQSIIAEPFRLQAGAGSAQPVITESYRMQPTPAQAIISEPYRLQASQPSSDAYAPRVSANNNDMFRARELLELYSSNPAAFSLNPSALRSMNPAMPTPVAVVGMTDLQGSSYGLLSAQGDYFDKRISPGYADVNLAQAQPFDMFAPPSVAAGSIHDPSSRSYQQAAAAAAMNFPAGSLTFVPAQPSVLRGNQQSHVYRLF